jgi:hypothetical protein
MLGQAEAAGKAPGPLEPIQSLLRVGQTALKMPWKASPVGILIY